MNLNILDFLLVTMLAVFYTMQSTESVYFYNGLSQ